MLYYVTREQHAYTIDRLLGSFKNSWLPRPAMQRLSYETLFALKRAPIGNYVFTDIDRLSGYEIDAASEIVKSVVRAAPGVLISNPPNRVLNRYGLLRRLYEAGINSFNVWRLDEGRMPTAYPVFIRREQDALGAESPLLHNEAEYRAAVASLLASGKGLTGRVAVQYVRATGPDGMHRKYGAFCLRGLVVPQHLMISESWVVKRDMADAAAELSEEEEGYVTSNPHADRVREIFRLAQIDFGRMDYGLVDGRMEVFEINTNPSFPRARITQDRTMIRRRIVIEGVVAGFDAMNAGEHEHGLVRFRTPKPKLHRLRNRPWTRRLKDMVTWCRWQAAELSSQPVEQRKPQPKTE
ncbi:hypothetical protein [Dongia deserti]|uniref:hypothetical protein n=1 Tax=Dongia deserti TaxID=2268030 RepID=UPI000E6491B3|nr:hypothetical protein [Dongia deserti]